MTGTTAESDRFVPLTAEDRAILELESATVVGHTCVVILLRYGAPGIQELREAIAARLPATPALTRKLTGTPSGPAWVGDGDFDITNHVAGVPESSGLDQEALRSEVARLFAEPLDRIRPLWRIDVLPLHGGGRALVWRIHHALADGATTCHYAEALLWDAASVVAAPPRTISRLHAQPDARRREHIAAFLQREFGRARDRSPFDGEIDTLREVAFTSVPMTELHAAAKDLGGATLNDAVITSVVGGLRHWMHLHHRHLNTVRVKVPVSLHRPGDDTANRDSFFTVAVPLHERDPVARLLATHAATTVRKSNDDAERMDALLASLGRVSPAMARWCAHVQRNPRSFALNVSNVVGPTEPVAVLGCPVEEVYTIAEIGRRHALRVSAISMGGTLFFSVCADPTIIDHVPSITEGINAEADALITAATQ